MDKLTFRTAGEQDCEKILFFIRELAKYEKMEDEVVATPELLREWIFEKQKAEVIFPTVDGQEVGFALFFHNFSTFLGRAGLYLEDLFILKEHRGKGYGKMLVEHAIGYARTLSPCTLMLTSNPTRIAANELYRASGFEQKITNVYKMSL